MSRKPDADTTRAASAHLINGQPAHDTADGEFAGHYLHAAQSPVPGIIGLMVALALLAFGIFEIRQGVPDYTALTVATAGATATEGAPVLRVAAEEWMLNDQPVEDNDILFRLSAMAAKSDIIIVEHAVGLSATRLTRALEMVNQAGFTQVGVRASPGTEN